MAVSPHHGLRLCLWTEVWATSSRSSWVLPWHTGLGGVLPRRPQCHHIEGGSWAGIWSPSLPGTNWRSPLARHLCNLDALSRDTREIKDTSISRQGLRPHAFVSLLSAARERRKNVARIAQGVSYFKDLETKGYQYTNGCINRCAETDGTLSEGPNELWMLSVVHSLVLGEASAQSGRQGFESSSATSSPCSLEPVPYLLSLDSVVPKVPVTETQSVFGLREIFRGSG